MNPAKLDTIVPDAMRDENTWQALLADIGPEKIRGSLSRLRADMKLQRSIKGGLANAGDIPRPDYDRWRSKAARFEQEINRRLTEIQVNHLSPTANRGEESNLYYRRRHKEDHRIIQTLAVAIYRYIEDSGMDEGILEDALDVVRDFGKNYGELSLLDGINQGLIPLEQP